MARLLSLLLGWLVLAPVCGVVADRCAAAAAGSGRACMRVRKCREGQGMHVSRHVPHRRRPAAAQQGRPRAQLVRLAPFCRVNRIGVLVAAALLDAGVVCALAAVPLLRSAQVAMLYVLLALQFSAAAFYEPGEASCSPGASGLPPHSAPCRGGAWHGMGHGRLWSD